ncbi:hypothetical protein [Streptomyces sp. NPDC048282]|uniref:Vgb family protein n=1 Tax=Streptomyces sp. NPDC048282 TaxID=3365528 RepID=UPI00370FC3D1
MWFTASGSNSVDRIDRTGHVTRYRLPDADGDPAGIAAGPDGRVWFTDESGGVGRVAAAGRSTVVRVPHGPDKAPFRLTTGPDRTVWFTELLGNAIGRIRSL